MSKTYILQAIQDHYKFEKDTQFAKFLGVTPQVLSNWKSRGSFDINIVYTKCVEFSLEWLVTGMGDKLKSNNSRGSILPKRNLIPLYNDVATIGGTTEMSATLDAVSHTTEYIDAGDWFPGATDAIRHYGSSMIEYPSGSILALKRVEDMRLIFWGRTYCIETTEGRLTKRLNKSKNKDIVMAYSTNNETYPDGCLIHEPIEIPIDTIRRVFQVLGCVTKEYSNGTVGISNKNN